MKYMVIIAKNHRFEEDRRITIEAQDAREAFSMAEKEIKGEELIYEITETVNVRTGEIVLVYHCLGGFTEEE